MFSFDFLVSYNCTSLYITTVLFLSPVPVGKFVWQKMDLNYLKLQKNEGKSNPFGWGGAP